MHNNTLSTRTQEGVITLPFGKHAGMRVTHVPIDYLQWLSRKDRFVFDCVDYVQVAKDECVRRGTSYEGIMPSHHAVDRFSQRFLSKWTERNIGLSTYISMLSEIAWNEGIVKGQQSDGDGLITIKKVFDGVCYVFACNNQGHPTGLKTVQKT